MAACKQACPTVSRWPAWMYANIGDPELFNIMTALSVSSRLGVTPVKYLRLQAAQAAREHGIFVPPSKLGERYAIRRYHLAARAAEPASPLGTYPAHKREIAQLKQFRARLHRYALDQFGDEKSWPMLFKGKSMTYEQIPAAFKALSCVYARWKYAEKEECDMSNEIVDKFHELFPEDSL